MAIASPKPVFWLLEEATPEVAQLMFQLERSVAGGGVVQRVSYTDALRQLPREQVRAGIAGIICFSLTILDNLAALLKGYATHRPHLCFYPTTYETLAALRPGQRWPVPVSAVARHGGEAALYELSGIKPELIVRLNADADAAHLPEGERESGRPLRIGFAWHNLAPAQHEGLATAIARWRQRAPERYVWCAACLPGEAPPADLFEGVSVLQLAAEMDPVPALDVLLADPWWPDMLPRPWRAPVRIYLPPGGSPGDAWEERLQALMDLGDQAGWEEADLVAYVHQPLWRHLLKGEERAIPLPLAPDLGPLEAARDRWHPWLEQARQGWQAEQATEPRDLTFYFRVYDYRVQLGWSLDLWKAYAAAQGPARHAVANAMNALALQHTNAAWLLKRLMLQTPKGKAGAAARRLGRKFWGGLALRQGGALLRWAHTLWRCGRDETADPLAATRLVGRKVLQAANVEVVRRNEPRPVAGLPTLYLMSHRHGELDPFLLLDVLPEHLAVVVGPRAQRWPLIRRLGYSSGFVLTGRERGVVIADAIAAVRARRALALYPEVAEPTYMGEGAPLRTGLLWIVQALEHSQVIPVVLDDAFRLGPAGGRVEVWFGDPIPMTPDTAEGLLEQVRMFFHQHVARMNTLDGGAGGTGQLLGVVPAAPAATRDPVA